MVWLCCNDLIYQWRSIGIHSHMQKHKSGHLSEGSNETQQSARAVMTGCHQALDSTSKGWPGGEGGGLKMSNALCLPVDDWCTLRSALCQRVL